MDSKSVLSGHLLARNAIWSFLGMAAPLLAGLFAIPLLINEIGNERFGLLAIIWMGVGYFSLFDMGLGRALTKLVAERVAQQEQGAINALVWTALQILMIMGLLATCLLFLLAAPLVHQVFNVPLDFHEEATHAFRLLALGIPIVVLSTALIGVLEAHQCFSIITTIRIPLGTLTFLAPLITAQFDPSLTWATLALVVVRFIAMLIIAMTVALVSPAVRRPCWLDVTCLKSLVSFGGWLTVSSIVGPIMVYFDRFLIGTLLTMSAVTYYVTPMEILSRLQIVPNAIVTVLFPALTMAIAVDRQRLTSLYRQASDILFFIMLPIMTLFFLFGPLGLKYWVGEEVSIAATPVVYWIASGWLINVLAKIPYTTLQSAGRPDLTAKTHLAELLPYVVLLFILTKEYGVAGTAAAWFIRVLADTVILNLLAVAHMPELSAQVKNGFIRLVLSAGGLGAAWMVESLLLRVGLSALICLLAGTRLWPAIKVLMIRPKEVATEGRLP